MNKVGDIIEKIVDEIYDLLETKRESFIKRYTFREPDISKEEFLEIVKYWDNNVADENFNINTEFSLIESDSTFYLDIHCNYKPNK